MRQTILSFTTGTVSEDIKDNTCDDDTISGDNK